MRSRLSISGSPCSEGSKLPGRTPVEKPLALLLGVLLTLVSLSAGAAAPKRVLVFRSYGTVAPVFTTLSTIFQKTLTEELGERVDLDEVSLDTDRVADDPEMEAALVDYLQKRHAKWRPDLVVPVGSPAAIFVARHRDRLFPAATPIIYAGMDQRRLPPGALQRNAAFVGESYKFNEVMEDILQMAPATTNLAVVLGASQVERYWAGAIQQEWAPFTNRLGITWLNGLSFDRMLERVSKLPPRSFIFLIMLKQDAAGVTYNVDMALKQIHAVATAPVNSLYQHHLGLGIVGGRLYDIELDAVESARVAVRVLRGEPATNFPPKTIPPRGPQYDWRELQRWNISEDRLPPGSAVLFREPGVWERYKWRIIAIAALILVEALLIFVLLVNLLKRRRLEEESRGHAAELAHVTRVSTLGELSGSLAHELNQPLTAILSNAQAAQRFLSNGTADLDEVRDILKDIVDQDRRAGEIIQRMRGMLKKGEVNFQPLDLNGTIQEVLALMRSDLVTRHVAVATQLSPRLPLVHGDRIQIQQVLMNLIVNSCDAMGKHDTSKRRLTIETEHDGDVHALVSVSDCGPGIPAGETEKIFQPFYSTKAQGIGMGLAICRSIVVSHGGRVWVANHNGSGALFHFTVPIHKEAKS